MVTVEHQSWQLLELIFDYPSHCARMQHYFQSIRQLPSLLLDFIIVLQDVSVIQGNHHQVRMQQL
jgi:hypothetical protein